MPELHPTNNLIEKDTSNLLAGLERVKLKEVREEYGYGGSSGLGSTSASVCDSQKSNLDSSCSSSISSCLNSRKFYLDDNCSSSISSSKCLNSQKSDSDSVDVIF